MHGTAVGRRRRRCTGARPQGRAPASSCPPPGGPARSTACGARPASIARIAARATGCPTVRSTPAMRGGRPGSALRRARGRGLARRPAPWRRCRLGLGRRGRRRVVRAAAALARRVRRAGVDTATSDGASSAAAAVLRVVPALGRSRRGGRIPGIGGRRRGRCRARRRLPRRGPALRGGRWPPQPPRPQRARLRSRTPRCGESGLGPGRRGDRLDVLGLTLRRRRDAGRLVDRTGVAARLRARHLRAHELLELGGTSLHGSDDPRLPPDGRPCGARSRSRLPPPPPPP